MKEQLIKIVGEGNVLGPAEIKEQYGKDYSVERPGLFTCVVRPRTVAETQEVIQLANRLKFAVVPQSSGVHFNGGAVPKMGGVVLDLSGMHQIVEIVDEPMVAYLQVGVNWEQFYSAMEAKGYRPLIPLLPHPARSVIMDYLEREQPVVQNHESSDPLLCMQVIWGNGELFVTGSASTSSFRRGKCMADGVCPTGPGPVSYDTFLYGAQGTIGVVTWGVVEFEEMPTLSKCFFIPTKRAGDAIEPMYNILRLGICNECLLVNKINLATILTEEWPEQFDALRKTLPEWTIIMVSSALKRRPEEKIQYQENALREVMLSTFREFDLLTALPGVPAVEKKLPDMLKRPWPKDRTYWKHAYKGGCQDLMFMTTLERIERFIPVIIEVAAKYQYPTNEIGCYVQPVQDGHACQMQFSFYYEPSDKTEHEKIRGLYYDAAAAVLDLGAYFNRPYPMIADMVFRRYSEYAHLLKRFKKHFDPNGILNPGNLCF